MKLITLNKFYVSVFLTFFSSVVLAEWIEVGRANDNGQPILYDSSTIVRKGNVVDVWTVNNFPDAAIKKDPSVKSYSSKERINCAEGSVQSLTTIYYSELSGKGNIVDIDKEMGKQFYFPPKSLIALVAKKVCK